MTIPQLKLARRNGLSTSALLAILILHQHGYLTMTALANAMETENANTTKVAGQLIKKGLAFREDDPKDRRIVRIVLTGKGGELAVELKEPEPELQPI